MPRVYIGVGSNIDPELNIPAALGLLKSKGRIAGVSTFYRTQAIASSNASGSLLPRSIGAEFYNGVIRFETCYEARELKFEVLRGIEQALGRVRSDDKCAPRPIDLDIVVYGDEVIDEPDMVIPDPEIPARAFLAVPLLELEPEIVLPGMSARLADVCVFDASAMTALDEFTDMLRREAIRRVASA